ncbi:hypothetical protein F4824DRAFT_458072 [Ustulina deusta]|nr:hypothetical protein F4824DRAFT_458072 [Ustulina deusta]
MDSKLSGSDKSLLSFFHLLEYLKHLPRTGWLRMLNHPESVGSHSFRVAIMSLFAPHGLDRSKCMLIGLCHDLAESVVGDIPTYAGISKEQKHKMEASAFQYIKALLQATDKALATEVVDAWEDYEHGKSAEGRWVKEVDKLDCIMQAQEYEGRTEGENLFDEFQGLSSKISSAKGKQWLEMLQRERLVQNQKRRQNIIFIIGDEMLVKSSYALLAEKFPFQRISLQDILREKSVDLTYHLSQYLRDCLAQDNPVPVQLSVGILEEKLIGMDEEWCLVEGFPEQLLWLPIRVRVCSPVVDS